MNNLSINKCIHYTFISNKSKVYSVEKAVGMYEGNLYERSTILPGQYTVTVYY